MASTLDSASFNLEVGRLYMSCKVIAISILEALADQVGVDVPIAVLLGALPAGNTETATSPLFLLPTDGDERFQTEAERAVYDLLAVGRPQSQNFDLKNSPIAAIYFYSLGRAGMIALGEHVAAYQAGDLSSLELLAIPPADLVAPIRDRIVHLFQLKIEALERAL